MRSILCRRGWVIGWVGLSCSPVCADVTHHYRFDETFQHEVVADSVGTVDASSSSLLRGRAGVISGAFELNQADPDRISFGPSSALLPSGDFTITLWVRGSADGFDDNERILDCSNGDSFAQMDQGFNFKKQGGTLRVFVGDGTNKAATASSASVLAAEAWYLVAFRFEASTNPGVTSDGSSAVTAIPLGSEILSASVVAGLTDSVSHAVGSPASATELILGARPDAATPATLALDGQVDDLRIHDSVLTDQQLVDLHNECVGVASCLRWIFNVDGDLEGWSGSGLSDLSVAEGNLVATSSGNDPSVLSPDGLGLDLTGISKVFVKARNATPLTSGKVAFQTESDAVFAGNEVPFTAVANDPVFTLYEVDMSGHPDWVGTLKRLRIDLSDGVAAGGQVFFDRIAIGASGNRPNVIVMMADDLGWRDVTPNGTPFYETPNIQRLADAGINYPNSYAANPLCSPTRAGVLTGLYPARVRFNTPSGHVGNIVLDPTVGNTADPYLPSTSVGTRTRLPNSYVTYADLLKKEGYATAFIGKWHLGKDEYIPDNQGFDFVIGGRQHPGPPGGFFAPFTADSNIPANWPDGTPVANGDHITDILGAWAADFIGDHRNQPFLMNLWWYDVHGPFETKQALRQKYLAKRDTNPDPEGRQDSPTMAGMVEVMDDAVGTVLDKLEELGLDDDTIIFFTSDNGGWMYTWLDDDLAVPADNYPARAGKACIWDGGTRVPFIVRWPGEVAEGVNRDDLVNNLDIYSTILEMTGVEQYDGYPVDSQSLVPSLKGQAPANGNLIFNQFPQSPPATGTFPGVWVRRDNMKLIRFFHGNGSENDHRYELYDMASDPGEETNLAADQPALVAELDALISQHLADTEALVPNFNQNFVPPTFDRWIPNKGVWVQDGGEGALKMVSNSFLPALDSPDLSALPAPAKVRVRMTSRSYGDGRIWWKMAPDDAWDLAKSVSFPVTHDNVERVIEIPIQPGGPVAGVRFQPSTGYFQTDVDFIEILDASETVIEVMSRMDSDGDGATDGAETGAKRDPNDASDFGFEFNAPGDDSEWGSNNIAGLGLDGGSLVGTSTNGDPQVFRTDLGFPGDLVPKIMVRLQAESDGTFQFFWGRQGADSFAAARRIDLSYTSSPGWQWIEVPTSTSPLAAEWNGQTITRLRIDPVSSTDTAWEIDSIRGTDGDRDKDGLADAAEGFPDRDSDGDGLEDWADKDSDNDSVPDAAEAAAGRDPYSAVEGALNADGDPYSDLFEMVAGTDPDDPADQLDLAFTVSPEDDKHRVTATLNGKAGRVYRLRRSSTLLAEAWTEVDQTSLSTDGVATLSELLDLPKAFYSIEVLWPY